MDAAKFSLENGADYVEMDIRFTKDNIPVIAHDADAARLYGTELQINEMSCAEFLALRNKQHPYYGTFTLDTALEGGVFPILFHIKERRIKEIMEHVDRCQCRDKVVMGVQTPEDAALLRDNYPGVSILAFMQAPNLTEEFAMNGAHYIRLWEEWATLKAIKQVHALGCGVWIMAGLSNKNTGYTHGDNLRRWAEQGVQGILANEVSTAAAELNNPVQR